jgi:hypothetical protein
MYRFVNIPVVAARECQLAEAADVAQVASVIGMGKERRMTCSLVNDVRRGRVCQMVAGSNVRGDG